MQPNEMVNVTIPKALLDAIDEQAKTEFRNRGELLREAARFYLAQKGGLTNADTLTSIEQTRIHDIGSFAGFGSAPQIILSCAYRSQPNKIKDIFTAEAGAMKLMERPSKLRNGGWDLETQDRARPIAGDFLEVKNDVKLLRLYRDGQQTFAGGMGFFGTGANGPDDGGNFNLLSVAELITNFVTFTKVMSDNLEHDADSAIYSIAVLNPGSEDDPAPVLRLMGYNGVSMREVGTGLGMEWVERHVVSHSASRLSIERIAYLLYSEFCYFFGVRSDELPYVNKKTQEVDKSKFRWISG